MIEPIQVPCPLCTALPGEPCRSLATGANRAHHVPRIDAAKRRPIDPRQTSLLDERAE